MITVKTKIVIATGLFSALLCSCSLQKDKANGIESDPSQYAIQPGAKINIPVDDKKVVDFDSIFSDYYFIKLETTAESLIDETNTGDGLGNRILLGEDNIFISNHERILVFNTKGKFVREINHKGQDGESYISILTFNLLDENNIVILDRMGHSLVTYSVDDKFVSKVSDLPFNGMEDFVTINDSLAILRFDTPNDGHELCVINIGIAKPIRLLKSMLRSNPFGYNFFSPKYHGKYLLAGHMSTDIYEVDADSATIRYSFDFGDYNLPVDYWKDFKSTIENLMKQADFIGHVPFFSESDHSLLLRFRGRAGNLTHKSTGYAYVDKVTGNVQVTKSMRCKDYEFVPGMMFPQDDGIVVIPFAVSDIMSSNSEKLIDLLPALQEDDNPVLCIARLK